MLKIKFVIQSLFLVLVLVLLIHSLQYILQYKEASDASSSATREYLWYYLPNKENEQPLPMEKAKFFKDHDVIYIGDPNEKIIYLTFDDCPNNDNIPKILDILDRYDVNASFFHDRILYKEKSRRHPKISTRR